MAHAGDHSGKFEVTKHSYEVGDMNLEKEARSTFVKDKTSFSKSSDNESESLPLQRNEVLHNDDRNEKSTSELTAPTAENELFNRAYEPIPSDSKISAEHVSLESQDAVEFIMNSDTASDDEPVEQTEEQDDDNINIPTPPMRFNQEEDQMTNEYNDRIDMPPQKLHVEKNQDVDIETDEKVQLPTNPVARDEVSPEHFAAVHNRLAILLDKIRPEEAELERIISVADVLIVKLTKKKLEALEILRVIPFFRCIFGQDDPCPELLL